MLPTLRWNTPAGPAVILKTDTSLRRSLKAGSALLGALLCLGCASSEEAATEDYEWEIPTDFPKPLLPPGIVMTAAKVELGRHLFYDTRLSFNETLACSGCHEQKLAFTDGKALREGSTGELLPRNSMTLTNVAYRSTFTWVNPVLGSLEEQALVPLLGEFPVELEWSGHEDEIAQRFTDDTQYNELFHDAFGTTKAEISLIAEALAAFERTLLSFESPYDHWLDGDADAISEDAKEGAALFFSEKTECYHCHGGPDFTNSFRSEDRPLASGEFRNNGLYNLDGSGSYPPNNPGLYEFSREPADEGKFRVPTLRNVELTAPYMHDGSIETLEELIDHYGAGGRTVEEGTFAGDGSQSPLKDSLIFPLDLTDDEKAQLVAFLRSLTDESFITNPAFADPWR